MATKKTKAKDPGTVSMTVYVPAAIHERARHACLSTKKTLNEAVAEALTMWSKAVAS
jgi:predicted HicB family RNase H-like nuclease